jgi:hypothetical protein
LSNFPGVYAPIIAPGQGKTNPGIKRVVDAQATSALWLDRYSLPWVLATNNFERGVSRVPRERALTYRNLQVNPRSHVFSLVIDVDHPDAMVRAFNTELPKPHWVCESPSGRAHVGYMLEVPVTRNNTSNRRPEYLLAQVECSLIRELDGDPSYNGLLTKNPVHPDWETHWGASELSTLASMAKQLKLEPNPTRHVLTPDSGSYGRNVTMFNGTRLWAYEAVRRYWGDSANDFFIATLNHATMLNLSLPNPLSAAEVKGIAKSVAAWTWSEFTPETFSKIQAARGRKSGAKRSQTASKRADEIQALRDQGKKWAEVAAELGCSVGAAKMALTRATKQQA